MTINEKVVYGDLFAYDGCHKIYILEDYNDVVDAAKRGYYIKPINKIIKTYAISCDLKFISNWKLNVSYVSQDEDAIFNV